VKAGRTQSENIFRCIENLRAETHKPNLRVLFIVSAFPRTVSPSLGSCPASVGASGFLLASALLVRHKTLRSSGGQSARCVRPTSATSMTLRAPVPRAFPAHSATFVAWTSLGVLGSERFTRGPSASRHSRPLRRIAAGHTLPFLPLESLASCDAGALERGCCLPTAPIAIEPLTPLSPLPTFRRIRCAFALPSSFLLLRALSLFCVRKPPRSP